MKQKIIRILLSFGIHNWKYNKGRTRRICKWDGTKQEINVEETSGMSSIVDWNTVEQFQDVE